MTKKSIREHVSAFNENKLSDQHICDLKIAREIQQQFIPQHTISINNYLVTSLYRPSYFLSGDFFDYVALGKNKIGIFIVDVIGKGIKASFTTILIKSIFQQVIYLKNPITPKSMMTELNKELYSQIALNKKGGYGFYGVIDTEKHTLSYCHCGIGVANHYRGTYKFELNKYGSVGVGLIENTQYTEGITQLAKNDVIILSTDGIEDVKDESGKRIGFNWLDSLVSNNCQKRTTKSVINQIEEYIQKKTESREFLEDDIACICIEC